MKNLTRIQAWEKIRTAFKGYRHFGIGSLASYGLCFAARTLCMQGQISLRTFEQMTDDIHRVKPFSDSCGYYWPDGIPGANQRVKAVTKILARIKK